jgi:hypothetical protein
LRERRDRVGTHALGLARRLAPPLRWWSCTAPRGAVLEGSMREIRIQLGIIVLCALGGVGCQSGPIHDIDVEVDCNDLCNRYRDCYDSSYDVVACRNRCDETNNTDPASANECDTCLDSRSCTEAFACADECYGLLP